MSFLAAVLSAICSIDSCSFHTRLVEKPTAVPRATGSSIELAGCSKMKAGRVIEGMCMAWMNLLRVSKSSEFGRKPENPFLSWLVVGTLQKYDAKPTDMLAIGAWVSGMRKTMVVWSDVNNTAIRASAW